MSDGHIYALPYVDFSKAFNSVRLYINKDWLDEAGLEVPKTTEEFRQALMKVREKDSSRLGWVLESQYWTFLESFLAGGFGMGKAVPRHSVNIYIRTRTDRLRQRLMIRSTENCSVS